MASFAGFGELRPQARRVAVGHQKRRPFVKGRAGSDSALFAMLPVQVLVSDAARTLPHVAHRVLVALAAEYHGTSNGSLSLTRRTARDYGVANAHALGAALRELEARGLIRQTRPGTRIPPRSAFYALEWRRIDEPLVHDPHDAMPTLSPANRWTNWRASKSYPHWTTPRRSARWPKATSMSGARPHQNEEIGDARPH